MAGRYTRVFTAKNNLYALGSPVILSAGALLKDNQTGKILAQLKIRSIANKKIKALTLSVSSFDTTGAALGEDVSFEYLDLSVSRDEEFGQKTLIPLPNASTRAFDVTVTKVIFKDNDIWENDQKFSLTIPEPAPLAAVLQDNELVKQYALHFNQAVAKPKKVHDLWYCACGALNHQEEAVCPKCKNKLESLLACDFNVLKSERDERLAKEKAEKAAAEEAKRIEREKAAKKTMRAILAICAVIAIILVITKVIIPNSKYNAAVALMDEGKYEEAIAAFEAMNGYKDSVEQITACETGIKDNEYDAAVALMNEGKYEEAITAFEALDGYKDCADKIIECNYEIAINLMAVGKYQEAISAFEALDGYKESSGQIEKCKQLILANAKVGDYVYFGSYEQDNDKSNGAESIEWLVLDKQENKILVISKYGLDAKQYNPNWALTTWEKCTLRNWLNNEFYNTAFSSEDIRAITQTSVSADKNPMGNTNPGNDTTDNIFLLSINEANRYFSSDNARQCAATDYAIEQSPYLPVYKVDCKSACVWWLRSPAGGKYSGEYGGAAGVDNDGSISCIGYYANGENIYVRPAMWIDLGA